MAMPFPWAGQPIDQNLPDRQGAHTQSSTSCLFNATGTADFLDYFAVGPAKMVDLAFGPDSHLYVTNITNNTVLRFDGTTGDLIDVFASVNAPSGLVFGPDGHLYVSSYNDNAVLRYDIASGVAVDTFATGLRRPANLAFGPDSLLYVVDSETYRIMRYDETAASFVEVVGVDIILPEDLTFGPDGYLYLSGRHGSSIVRYDPTTGERVDPFTFIDRIPSSFRDIKFGPDGHLYLSLYTFRQVLRYNVATGELIDVFVSGLELGTPAGLTFGPDGNLYTIGGILDRVVRYEGPFAASNPAAGAPFSAPPLSLTGVIGGADWGDYDGDGDLDLIAIGHRFDFRTGFVRIARIYHNDNGVLSNTAAQNIDLPILGGESVVWGDYDGDGDLDLAATNFLGDIQLVPNRFGTFDPTQPGGFFLSNFGPITWGDYDNDGDLDLASGLRIYRNDNGTFSNDSTG